MWVRSRVRRRRGGGKGKVSSRRRRGGGQGEVKARRRQEGERGGEQKEKEKASKLTGEQRLKVTEIAQSAQLPEELSVAARGGHLPSAREGRGYKRGLQASLAGGAG